MNSRGSIWAKWDLHIHTPKSICNKYGGDTPEIWEQFITDLETLPEEVQVIGINDYYFIDGFEIVMDYKFNKGRLNNIKKIFPVLEFRIDTFASASETKFQKVNYHILFDIDESRWQKDINKIKAEFIERINLCNLPGYETKCLSIENFKESASDLQTAFNEIMPSTKQVMELLDTDTWRDRSFTLLGYKEWNNLDKGNQLKSHKDYLCKNVHAFFTATPTDSVENKKNIIQKFGDNPLIHSSDIHEFNKLGENYKCFTWIKAEPTFEGLKQILFEPNERLKIQENNPEYDEQKNLVIDSIKIINSNSWFGQEELLLNRGLISIIGEKGAGKTALLDILAVANDEGIYEQDIKNPYSFYNRAKSNLGETKVIIKNFGTTDVKEVVLDNKDVINKSNNYGKVRYLSLKELESYCDDKVKLQKFIKDIIHKKAPDTEEYDKKSNLIIKKIHDLNEKVIDAKNQVKLNIEIETQLQEKYKELEVVNNNEPKIKTAFTDEQAKLYRELLTNKQSIKSSVEDLEKIHIKLSKLITWIDNKINEFVNEFKEDLQEELNGFENEFKDEVLGISLDVKFEKKIISEKIKIIEDTIVKLKEDENSVDKQIEPLEKLNSTSMQESNIIKNWIDKKKELEDSIKQLQDKQKYNEQVSVNLKSYNSSRGELLKELLKNKIEQKEKYEELKEILEGDTNIKFDVEIDIDEKKIFDIESEIINHGKGNSMETIKKLLNEKFISNIKDLNQETINTIVDLWNLINFEEFIKEVFGENRDENNLMKRNHNILEFYDLIFGDYYNVNYSIKFKGRCLKSLSPGQKGLVLMKIFLKLDESNKPLLIDQPEDNLDNKSVYKDLVNDLKEIKKKRQIIIATHNPNLVINTDSEQVIVAKFEESADNSPKISYISGALEDINIRNMVCDILEGGDIAFMKREKRYNLA